MRLPTQILLLGATLAVGARAQSTAPAPAPSAGPAAAPVGPVAPAGDAAVQLEPLRVTADLWETPLDRIAASVTVLESADLNASGVRHFGDVVGAIPNLNWTGGTSRPRNFQIRGVGENSHFEGETPDSSVRFLVDDLDFTGLGTVASTFDTRQIEVLRGPQAGAFGANAAGGVIRLVSEAPTPVWTGGVEATVGSDDLRSVGAAAGGPLLPRRADELMIRVAAQQSTSDGFRKNVTLGRENTNERDEAMLRTTLTWNPNALWRWDGTLFFADADNGYDEFALDNNGRRTFSDEPGRDEQTSFAGSLRGVYSGWQRARLTTVTSAGSTDSLYSYDADWTAASYGGFNSLDRERDVFSQELRLDSDPAAARDDALVERWTLGAYYSRLDERGAYAYRDNSPYAESMDIDYLGENIALYGQAGRDLGARTRVIVGLRVEHVDIRGDTVLDQGFGPVALAPHFDDTLLGGKLTLEHDLGARYLAFASAARGYKAGGVNVDARINPAADPLTYDTEDLWNYEVGLRGAWLDQRLTGGLTAFYLDRRDAQVRDSAGFGGSYRFFTDNGDAASTYGLESSATYALGGGWSLHGSLGLMRSDLERFTLSNGNAGGGRELANTPRYGYGAGLRYRAPRGFFGNVEVNGRSEVYDSNSQSEERDAYTVVNAALGYAWREWTLTLWARNALDEAYAKRVYFFGNDPGTGFTPARYETRADPRQVGVTARYAF